MTTRFRQPRRLCPKHLDYVRSLPCCVCHQPAPSEAHHLKCTGERGMGRKSSDRYTVPLCAGCHRTDTDAVENAGSKNELLWFVERGVISDTLAFDLWQSSPHKDTEHDKPPQRERKSRMQHKQNASDRKSIDNRPKRNWPSSQPIRSQGFGKQKRKINGRRFNGEAVRYE